MYTSRQKRQAVAKLRMGSNPIIHTTNEIVQSIYNTNMKEDIFLKNGTLFATEYNRIVHGERGDYVEFEKEHIVPKLVSKFGNKPTDDLDIYYWWLIPVTDKNTKIYLQKKTVKYADYKIGKYYVSPYELKDFKDPEQLFPY